MEIHETTIPGLYYITDCIPSNILDEVHVGLEETFADTSVAFPVGTGKNSRMVAHYGYQYNYKTGDVSQPAPPFPPYINSLVDIIRGTGIGPVEHDIQLNQCLINRYEPGQGIAAHIDSLKYDEFIYCFTFGSGALMEFTSSTCMETNAATNALVKIYTEPNSLYIMSGDARYKWKHEMRPIKIDQVDSDNGIEKIKRGVRTSITFRSLKPK